MGSRPASLLTKKQRERIQNGFADLSGQQQRRDQQRIRSRIRAGVLDFETLGEYPDRQLELAFEDLSEDELQLALADATVFLERVRTLAELDRSAVLVQARNRVEGRAEREDSLRSLETVDLRTQSEIRLEAQSSVRDQLESNPWDERADGLLKLAGSASLPLFGILLGDAVLSPNLIATSTILAVLVYLLGAVVGVGLISVFLIKAAQALKHDVVPVARRLSRNPTGAFYVVFELLHRPFERMRRAWDEL